MICNISNFIYFSITYITYGKFIKIFIRKKYEGFSFLKNT